MQNNPTFEVLESKEDPLTGLVWQKVKLQAWVKNSKFTDSLTDFLGKCGTNFQDRM
ncbi:cytochrome c-type protein [Actinobacillus ureae]|nr:cytochrome c-type protein [Actinobacillus ureae]SUU49182.1 cytochrome c-type protein [Actinobacillus ureae]